MVEQFAGHLRVGFDAAVPVVCADVHGRVENVGEIVRQLGEVARADVQRDGFDAGGYESLAGGGVFQARGAPHLILYSQSARDGKRDLARRAGDQDLL